MGATASRPGESRTGYEQGDHICVLYDTAAEQLGVALDYVLDGLSRNERCLYAATSDRALEDFRGALRGAGIDPDAAVREGRLLLLTKERAHLRNGRFDCERMLAMLNEAVESALNDGFTGLRTCGDMSWLLDRAPGSEQVVEYESLLNQFFASVRGLGMCQYDRSRLPEGVLDHALHTHSSVVVDGKRRDNPFCVQLGASRSFSAPLDFRAKLEALRAM